MLWIPIRDSYCYLITFLASKFVAVVKGAAWEDIVRTRDAVLVSMDFDKGGKYVTAVIPISNSVSRIYDFAVPLTFALLATLFPLIKRKKRAYAEALLLLFFSHILYIVSIETTVFTARLMQYGIEPVNSQWLTFHQYLWSAMTDTSMSFGPFLITAYVFVRFRKIEGKNQVPV